MQTERDFPGQKWTRIVRAPFLAGMAISLWDTKGNTYLPCQLFNRLRRSARPAPVCGESHVTSATNPEQR